MERSKALAFGRSFRQALVLPGGTVAPCWSVMPQNAKVARSSPPFPLMTTSVAQQELLHHLDALARLHCLPDSAALTTSEAAVFLRSSVSALEAMRAKGTGPTYIQGGGKGAAGSNQKCLYEKSDLLAWQRANKVSSTVEAAVRKGQLFVSIYDLASHEPFWIDRRGQVAGMLEAEVVATVLARLGLYDIEWLPVMDALGRSWSDVVRHQVLASQASSLLRQQLQRIDAGLEATHIAAESSGGPAQ